MNNFYDIASMRQSCRNYSGLPVEKEKLMACIEAALIAPSACNGQPWHYTLVTNPEATAKVSKALQVAGLNRFTNKVPAFAIITQTASNLTSTIGSKIGQHDYSSIDIGLSAAHFVLQAEELGLSTCIMGAFNEKEVKSLLESKASDRIRLIIAVGYKDEADKFRNKKRKPQQDVLRIID